MYRAELPDDVRRACKGVYAARKKIREALYRHRHVLTEEEQTALEGCMQVMDDVEERLKTPPLMDDEFRGTGRAPSRSTLFT